MAGDDDQPQGTKYAFDISGEVESDPEWWKARGKTAEQAAEDLSDSGTECRADLQDQSLR